MCQTGNKILAKAQSLPTGSHHLVSAADISPSCLRADTQEGARSIFPYFLAYPRSTSSMAWLRCCLRDALNRSEQWCLRSECSQHGFLYLPHDTSLPTCVMCFVCMVDLLHKTPFLEGKGHPTHHGILQSTHYHVLTGAQRILMGYGFHMKMTEGLFVKLPGVARFEK